MDITLSATDLPAQPELQHVTEIAQQIDLDDPALSVVYGAETMRNISRFADTLLERVRAKDAGELGESLSELMLRVKGVDVGDLDKKSVLSNLPLIGHLFSTAERTIAQFQSLADHVETISAKLEESMTSLLYDISMLEQLFEHNQHFHQDLTAYIEAGKMRLEQARTEELPKLKQEAEASENTMLAQRVRDYAERINRFERRLHDLQLSRTITLQTAAQIRIIQSNNQNLAEKIQTSILSTIPLWKSQIVLALSLQKQQSAATLQKDVSDTTNELLRRNSVLLEQSAGETAREIERAVVETETLREVHNRLVSTIEQTLHISDEGRAKRLAAERELLVLEQDLRAKLTSLAEERRQAVVTQASGNN